jgi:hypothetical protein
MDEAGGDDDEGTRDELCPYLVVQDRYHIGSGGVVGLVDRYFPRDANREKILNFR